MKAVTSLSSGDPQGKQKEIARMVTADAQDVLSALKTKLKGLTVQEARKRLRRYGYNEIVHKKQRTWYIHLASIAKDPLNLLLVFLVLVSLATHDVHGAAIIFVMVLLSIFFRFVQEHRADRAAEKLAAMVSTHVTVMREGKEKNVRLHCIVPGDIVVLSAGDMIPADVRLLSCKDFFVNQAALTGESLPVEKDAATHPLDGASALSSPQMCFMGSHVQNGSATSVVIATGSATYLGSLAESVIHQESPSGFQSWIKSFTFLMIKIMAVIAPLVFLINGLSKGNWFEAFLFALAVAVGLTPEMLPMIMTVNLGKGALDMARKKVIVKKLEAIQSFGSMDILCTDKTGTLTQNNIVLEKYCDVHGASSQNVLQYAFLNSFYQTGLKNIIDKAILKHEIFKTSAFPKIDEIPFDFARRIMSVVVGQGDEHMVIAKGAPEEIFSRCTHYDDAGKIKKMHHELIPTIQKSFDELSKDGFRILAVAYKKIEQKKKHYSKDDEQSLTLFGYLAFFDPPKATAKETIRELQGLGITIKVLTGDNHLVAKKICDEVGLAINGILTGDEVVHMDDDALKKRSELTTIFARISPIDKQRIIRLLKASNHVVSYLGDGINDAPALKEADVGISVDAAVDIAKESADIILLEKSLIVLKDGVLEGRRIFVNILKYIKMSASSNFGNMFSVIGSSIFLPFLPMLPVQILLNNLLYDISQTTLPADNVDSELLARPQKWDARSLRDFIFFIGPLSSIFDYITYGLLLFVFAAWDKPILFHTGWFIESLLTQTLIIHVLRTNKIPFIQSRASIPVVFSTLAVVLLGISLPFSPYAGALGFTPLPSLFWVIMPVILFGYVLLTQCMKYALIHFEKKYV